MTAILTLPAAAGFNISTLSQAEHDILDADLFTRLCEELKDLFRKENKIFFELIKMPTDMEITIMNASFLRCIINDIISTDEYTLPGVAYYSDTPEEVVYEVITGQNINPSNHLVRKIMDLHRTVRPELYRKLLKKIISDVSLCAT